jgi:hypothetical protein
VHEVHELDELAAELRGVERLVGRHGHLPIRQV